MLKKTDANCVCVKNNYIFHARNGLYEIIRRYPVCATLLYLVQEDLKKSRTGSADEQKEHMGSVSIKYKNRCDLTGSVSEMYWNC